MTDYINANMWILYILSAVCATWVLNIACRRICHHFIKKAAERRVMFAEALLAGVELPLRFLIWLLGLSLACTIFLAHKQNVFLIENLSVIKHIGIVFLLCWSLVRFIHSLSELYLNFCATHSKGVDKTLIHATRQLLTIVVCVIGLLLIMQTMNIPVAGLLTFGGIGGAAVAFAAKDLLANFFGGLVVYVDRPFKVGDWIRSPDKNIEGVVEYIGWRMTQIRTFDKRPLYVPNGLFLTISVENPSRMLHRRIKTTIGIRYQDAAKVEKITQDIKAMLVGHESIDTAQSLSVTLVEFGPSSLNILVSAYCTVISADQFSIVQHGILLKILNIISENSAECAFPTQTLYLEPTPS